MCLAVAAVTGGNNYGRQSGGQVVTAYAPDTAIDYLLLRHEPRFSHYGALFRALADASVAPPAPHVKSMNSGSCLDMVSMTLCSCFARRSCLPKRRARSAKR
mgnify:CR=1 FL=1